MKPWFLSLICCIWTANVFAQNKDAYRVCGTVADEKTKTTIPAATILLLTADSLILSSTTSHLNGAFEILAPANQKKYLLKITYVGYQPFFKNLQSNPAERVRRLDTFFLKYTGLTLATVEVKSPVRFKKDTIEFNADAFKTSQHALIGEMLKKLPGVRMTADGTIVAMGEQVTKIYVDGRPLFNGDPAKALELINANLVNTVQLIDERNEHERFAGINGATEKIINLTTKKEMRNKPAGRIAAGTGTRHTYAADLALTILGDGQQLALYGKANNINNWQVERPLADNKGLNKSIGSGINFNKDLSKTAKLEMNYVLSGTKKEITQSSIRQNFLPHDSSWFYRTDMDSKNTFMQHGLYTKLTLNPDSSQLLTLTINMNLRNNSLGENQVYRSTDASSQSLNFGSFRNQAKGDNDDVFSGVEYSKKLNRQGTTVNIAVKYGSGKQSEDNYNASETSYITAPGEPSVDSIKQFRPIQSTNTFFQFVPTLIQPLSKSSRLRVTYIFTGQGSTVQNNTYDFDHLSGGYGHRNDSLSSHFRTTAAHHYIGAMWDYQKKNSSYMLGLTMLASNLKNTNRETNTSLNIHNVNIAPWIIATQYFSKTAYLRLNYSSDVRQPDIGQLLPVPDLSNPLYIHVGNPSLKPSREDHLNIVFNKLNSTTLANTSLSIATSLLSNRIVDAIFTDSLGRQISKPVNLDGSWSALLTLDKSITIREVLKINSSTTFTIRRDASWINNNKGMQEYRSIGQTIGVDFSKPDKLEMGASVGIQYNQTQFSTAENTDYNTHSVNGNAYMAVYLPMKIKLQGSMFFNGQYGLSEGYNRDMWLLNLALTKTLLKNGNGLVKLQAFDLFNKNVSSFRNSTESYIEDVNASTLRRFFLLTFGYYFQ
jgi:hypothetical protein